MTLISICSGKTLQRKSEFQFITLLKTEQSKLQTLTEKLKWKVKLVISTIWNPWNWGAEEKENVSVESVEWKKLQALRGRQKEGGTVDPLLPRGIYLAKFVSVPATSVLSWGIDSNLVIHLIKKEISCTYKIKLSLYGSYANTCTDKYMQFAVRIRQAKKLKEACF